MEGREIVGKGLSGAVLAIIVKDLMPAIIFLLISIFIFFSFFLDFLHRDYIPTTAKIVDIKEEVDGMYRPIYEYDYNGSIVKVESIATPDKEKLFVGSEVIIYYDPDNYNKIEIRNSESDKIAFFIGLIMLFLSVITIRNFINAMKILKSHNYNFLDVVDDEIEKQIEMEQGNNQI